MSERTDDLTREDEAVDEVGVDDSVNVDDIGIDDSMGIDEVGVDDSDAFETDFTDFGTDSEQATTAETATASDGAAGGRFGDAFSLPSFALQLVGAVAGLFVVGGAVPIGPLSGLLGIFVALFALGVFSTGSRYAEAGIAGGLVALVTTVVTSVSLSVFSGGMLPLVAGVAGGAVSLLGHYFGRDLRDGLTRDI